MSLSTQDPSVEEMLFLVRATLSQMDYEVSYDRDAKETELVQLISDDQRLDEDKAKSIAYLYALRRLMLKPPQSDWEDGTSEQQMDYRNIEKLVGLWFSPNVMLISLKVDLPSLVAHLPKGRTEEDITSDSSEQLCLRPSELFGHQRGQGHHRGTNRATSAIPREQSCWGFYTTRSFLVYARFSGLKGR